MPFNPFASAFLFLTSIVVQEGCYIVPPDLPHFISVSVMSPIFLILGSFEIAVLFFYGWQWLSLYVSLCVGLVSTDIIIK